MILPQEALPIQSLPFQVSSSEPMKMTSSLLLRKRAGLARGFFISFGLKLACLTLAFSSIPGKAFAAPISIDQMSAWIRTGNLKQIFEAMDRYKVEYADNSDRVARSLSMPLKTPEEKDESFRGAVTKLLNRKDSLGYTPLHWAIIYHNFAPQMEDVFGFLLENGADPMFKFPEITRTQADNLRNILGASGIRNASDLAYLCFTMKDHGQLEILMGLNADPKILERYYRSMHAADLDVEIPGMGNPLGKAIIDKNFDHMEALLQAGANVNHIYSNGMTPFYRIADMGPRELLSKRKLIDENLNVTSSGGLSHVNAVLKAENRAGRFSEMKSLFDLQKKMTALLIAKGANPFLASTQIESGFSFLLKQRSIKLIRFILEESLKSSDLAVRSFAQSWIDAESRIRTEAENEISEWISESKRENKKKFESTSQSSSIKRPVVEVLQRTTSLSEEESDSIDSEPHGEAKGLPFDQGESLESPWKIVERKKTASTAETSTSRRSLTQGPTLRVTLNGKWVTVRFNAEFYAHVSQRQNEVGRHDLNDEEIYEVLHHATHILESDFLDGTQRYLFISPMIGGGYMRVVISKRSSETDFNAITAFRSNHLPHDFDEAVLEMSTHKE